MQTGKPDQLRYDDDVMLAEMTVTPVVCDIIVTSQTNACDVTATSRGTGVAFVAKSYTLTNWEI